MAYFCIDRHGRAVNALFLDGHAARAPLNGFWKLQWHRGFEKREITGLPWPRGNSNSRFDPFANAVVDHLVRFLDAGGHGGGNKDLDVAEAARLAAVLAEERDGGHFLFAGGFDGV
jgi:prepilin-type processing-associated H-X9-DG protein